MSHFDLSCSACGATSAADMDTLACDRCAAPLNVRYDKAHALGDSDAPPMPCHDPASAVTLGEGDTPCVELPAVSAMLGIRRVVGKAEYQNPTGSFKDRGTAAMMSVAAEMGVTAVVEDSSGNAGASVAAYAARAHIEAHVFAPADAPPAKLSQIRVYGARAHLVEGPRQAAADAATAFCETRGMVYASHNLSPYFIEGVKTFAYEAARQLADDPPRHLVVPVGNGSLVTGPWKGYSEMLAVGRIRVAPRVHAVQTRAVMPIVAAYEGRPWKSEDAERTIAGGISVAEPPRRAQVLEVLRQSGGRAVAVEEADVARWQLLLAEREGIYAEPTSAAAFAGLERLAASGAVGADDCILVAITGSGLKDTPPLGHQAVPHL